jgi:protein TonB
MNEVTEIIVARAQQHDALKTMVVWSVAAHIVLIAAFLFAPPSQNDDAQRVVMTISLGGAPGPQTGGLTQIGGRAVQAPPPQEPVRRAESAPAPTRPAMTLPDPKARIKTVPNPKQSPADATSRTLSTGEQPRDGNTRAETGAKGQGFGLSSGGGGGDSMTLDVSNFCCPEYLAQMRDLITRNWQQNQGIVGSTVMKFTIQRDGSVLQPAVERSSGFVALDTAAQRALLLTKLGPLPAAFPNPTLTVHLRFDYQR